MSRVTVTVKGTARSAARLDFRAGGHEMIIDEPKEIGGTDLGPSPLEYLLGAHIGCLNFIGQQVAKEMGFEIRSLEVTASGWLNTLGFRGKDPDVRAGFQEIQVDMHLDADIDEATRMRWVETVESRCPVSDNLINATAVTVSVVS